MPVPVKLNGVKLSTELLPRERMLLTPEVRLRWESAIQASGGELRLPALDFNPISDQQQESSCVANAVCDGFELCAQTEWGHYTNLSRNAHYYWTRCRHGGQTEDEGTYIHLALEQGTIVGFVPEGLWPYDPEKVNVAPPNHIIVLASQNRLAGYYAIDGLRHERVQGLLLALRAHQPCVAAFKLGPEYFQAQSGQVMGPPKENKGLHAQLIVGYRVRPGGGYQFLIRNSWGEGWGDAGYIWVEEEYFDPSYTHDIYALTKMQELIL